MNSLEEIGKKIYFALYHIRTKYENLQEASYWRRATDNLPDFTITFLDSRPFLRIPALSNSTRPLKPSSIKIQPLNPLDMQSFQNDV